MTKVFYNLKNKNNTKKKSNPKQSVEYSLKPNKINKKMLGNMLSIFLWNKKKGSPTVIHLELKHSYFRYNPSHYL
ncbi:hypothetical protein CN481_15485 [Bacillus sp. AFS006103]|nr:hypothetical protein CN481_15485 [Bacillus sp. AFS006103]